MSELVTFLQIVFGALVFVTAIMAVLMLIIYLKGTPKQKLGNPSYGSFDKKLYRNKGNDQ